MTASSTQSQDRGTDFKGSGCCGVSARANWSGTNLIAMVAGFVLFWPLGLFMLYWIFKGREVRDLPQQVMGKWHELKRGGFCPMGEAGSDNPVFNAYQQAQYDRIREIKAEIKARARRFAEFRARAKARADEEEFRRFMDDSPAS